MLLRVLLILSLAPLLLEAQFGAPKADARPNVIPPSLEGVGIDQRLNQLIPLDTAFRDESGRAVELREFFGAKPVVLALVYYECPMLCTEILNGMVGALKAVPFNAGSEYEVVAVSFNPADTPELAAAKKQSYVRRYGRTGSESGFHFLTGDPASIDALTRSVGFRYKLDPVSGQFAHASAIYVLTPQGRLSHYFYGVEYAPRDLRLGLVEASQNKIGSPVDQLLLFCYHYDAATGKYGAMVMNILRLSGLAFLLVLGISLFVFWRRDIRRDRREVLSAR